MRSRECGLVDCLNALAAPPNALAAPASADVEKTMTGGRSGEDTTLAKHCIMILCSRRMELAVAVGILCSRCMEWCNTGSEEAS